MSWQVTIETAGKHHNHNVFVCGYGVITGIAEPLWTEPGLKRGITLRQLIFT